MKRDEFLKMMGYLFDRSKTLMDEKDADKLTARLYELGSKITNDYDLKASLEVATISLMLQEL